MEEEKITLDRSSFRALTSETRIKILKSLSQRRKTLSELSKEFGMSVSTVKEHLDILCSAELIIQKDDGHKWKYYELTRKGRNILSPGERRIIVLLGISLLAAVGTAWDMAARFNTGIFAPEFAASKGNDMVAATAASAAETTIPYLHIIGIILFGIVFAVCLILFLRRRKPSSAQHRKI